jgi:hypothetical protein
LTTVSTTAMSDPRAVLGSASTSVSEVLPIRGDEGTAETNDTRSSNVKKEADNIHENVFTHIHSWLCVMRGRNVTNVPIRAIYK